MKYLIHVCLITILLFWVSLTSFAQNKKLSGKVLDECHNPVPYASVYFKNSRIGGTNSDLSGYYTIGIPNDSDTLVCSRIGYVEKKEPISNNTIINVIMQKQAPLIYKSSITGTHKFSAEEKLSKAATNHKDDWDDNRIYVRVESSASFPGGDGAFNRYLTKAIVYPDSATISEVKGIVKVGFIIDREGHPSNILLLRGINKFADEAVLKAISNSPKWAPPNQNGRFVEQSLEVSVAFDISGVD